MINKLVPENFIVPQKLETEIFRLRMLTTDDVEKDYEAVMSSRDHLLTLSGEDDEYAWPRKDMTIEENLKDLQRHQNEFLERTAFTYTVMSLDEKICLGCVYINISEKKNFDAEVYLWARASEIENGLEEILFETVKNWIKEDWPFEKVDYPQREIY
ncbi:GNAT family N-acetyltransferase [Tepidibacter mesophilus]|uniref:GNAT family N-acetyltransferase n=1 Tax=Tepidibacter mesophilus TaxID=655607 RepID=UPI000C07C1D2|nr:GNAT family N-acetyltransferase [Tepidibacter mesophilus]